MHYEYYINFIYSKKPNCLIVKFIYQIFEVDVVKKQKR